MRAVWRRIEPFIPSVGDEAALGLNQRLRVYRYEEGDSFGMHHDGSWPGSGFDPATGAFVRDRWAGTRRSQMTVLLYLDPLSSYDGGATTFATGAGERVAVRVSQGGALCFFHGEHPLSPLHEGSLVARGTKHVIRTDVLYRDPRVPAAGEALDVSAEDGGRELCLPEWICP